MKKLLPLILLFSLGCKKDSPGFYEKLVGIWKTYETISPEGFVNSGPFNGASVFGVYTSGLELHADKTYNTYMCFETCAPKEEEYGDFKYYRYKNILQFSGMHHKNYEVIKMTDDELWLKNSIRLIKLRKE